MFSSRVSSLGLARGLQATIPHTAPVDGVSPYIAEKQYYLAKKKSLPYAPSPVVASRGLLSTGLSATVNAFGNHQVRFAHTDLSCPDFTPHRRESTTDPHEAASETKYQRRAITYGLSAIGTIPAIYMGKATVKTFLGYFGPDEFSKALSKIEVNISNIQRGYGVTIIFQGKPLFIRHRTEEEIAEINAVSQSELRDPQLDTDRFLNNEWTIVIGVCTHLGCVPISHAGDFNGYFCPCHGSHYDASGRIRKGPAPLNLEVPKHSFMDDDTLLVG